MAPPSPKRASATGLGAGHGAVRRRGSPAPSRSTTSLPAGSDSHSAYISPMGCAAAREQRGECGLVSLRDTKARALPSAAHNNCNKVTDDRQPGTFHCAGLGPAPSPIDTYARFPPPRAVRAPPKVPGSLPRRRDQSATPRAAAGRDRAGARARARAQTRRPRCTSKLRPPAAMHALINTPISQLTTLHSSHQISRPQ